MLHERDKMQQSLCNAGSSNLFADAIDFAKFIIFIFSCQNFNLIKPFDLGLEIRMHLY